MKSKFEWVRKAQRCLRMLSELHRLGYQQLRGMSYFNAQGFRFAIAPRDYFADNGIAIPTDKLSDSLVAITGAGHYFSWTDTDGNDARTWQRNLSPVFRILPLLARDVTGGMLVGYLNSLVFLSKVTWSQPFAGRRWKGSRKI